MTSKAHYRLEGETVSKYWSLINKGVKARDVIYALGRPGDVDPETNAQRYETRSDKMAELTRDYHNDLQSDGMLHSPDERERITDEINILAHVDRLLPDNRTTTYGKP